MCLLPVCCLYLRFSFSAFFLFSFLITFLFDVSNFYLAFLSSSSLKFLPPYSLVSVSSSYFPCLPSSSSFFSSPLSPFPHSSSASSSILLVSFLHFQILPFSVCLNIPVSSVVSSGSEGAGHASRNSWPHCNRLIPVQLHRL